ncbi:hypothetical protein COOONC_04729, partial [Cooperia oncophora]
MYGRKRKPPTHKECAFQTMLKMRYAAGAIFVSKMFDQICPNELKHSLEMILLQASKNSVLDMVKDLREAFEEMLIANDWMDETTKK